MRQKENPAVVEFGRIFAKEQAREDEPQDKPATTTTDTTRPLDPEAVATECYLFGYQNKASEWKAISKYEKVVAPSIICEDYPREDPNLFMSNSPLAQSRNAVVVHKNLSKDALRKSRVYKGGKHWIKVTFDSYQAAERACFYSPIDIDGYSVHCEMWHGRGPTVDVPIVTGSDTAGLIRSNSQTARTLQPSQSSQFLSGKDSAVAGFERAMQTLPRSHALPDIQYGQPPAQDDMSLDSTTASSATATEALVATPQTGLRSRSVPHLPSQTTPDPTSEYMTHIPSVKRVILRPISEALPKQPSFAERVLRSLPIVSWFIGDKTSTGDFISDGPLLKEDGSWDPNNGVYWSFWHTMDSIMGTDFCGLKED